MARLMRLLALVVSSFLSAWAFVGDLFVDVMRLDIPPVLDANTSLHADQVQRTARMEVADTGGAASAMFSERARDHQLFIGDGFTYGGLQLPI